MHDVVYNRTVSKSFKQAANQRMFESVAALPEWDAISTFPAPSSISLLETIPGTNTTSAELTS